LSALSINRIEDKRRREALFRARRGAVKVLIRVEI
jgi:hypothetical protein